MSKKKQAEDTYEPDDIYYQDAVPDATGDTRPPTEAETAVHQPYPAMRYKFAEPVTVVDNADEDAALGEGWSKSPTALLPPDVPAPVVKGAKS